MIFVARLVRVSTAVAVMGVLGACGGAGPEPQTLSDVGAVASTSPSADGPIAEPSPSVVPTEVPADVPADSHQLELPEGARALTSEGAQEFVLHHIAVYNEALGNGLTADLDALATQRCRTCAAYGHAVREVYTGGGTIEGGRVAALSSAAPKLSGQGRQLVQVNVRISSERDLDRDGHVVKTFPGEKATMAFYLVRDGKQWRVDEIKLVVFK